MKVVRCSDEAYAQLAEFAASNRLNIAQSVERAVECLVRDVDEDPDVLRQGILDDVGEVLRVELHRMLGDADKLGGGLSEWIQVAFKVNLVTNTNVNAICKNLGIEPESTRG